MKKSATVSLGRRASRDPLGIPLNDEIFLQPWFVPKPVYAAIRRLLPGAHLAKMRYYFDDHGCMRCGETNRLYGSNGLYERCTVLLRYRVVRSLERRLKQVGIGSEIPSHTQDFDDRAQTAQRILKDVVGR